MLSSYRPIIGTATMIWDTTSGGVMMAAMTKMMTIMTLRPLTSHSALMRPSPVSRTEITGSSNTRPKITNSVSRKLIYCWMLMEAETSTSCVNWIRNRSTKGRLMKRAKATPSRKNSEPASSEAMMKKRSFFLRPGLQKA